MTWREIADAGSWTTRATTYGQVAMYVGIALLVALVAGAVVGGLVGYRWHKGAAAIDENKSLRREIADLGKAVREAQAAVALVAGDAQAASAALQEQSKGLSDDIETNRLAATAASEKLEQAIARNPAVAAVRADADFMHAWNAANRGDPAGSAGTNVADPAGGRRPDGAVPRAPAGGHGSKPGGAGAKPPGLGADLSRLQGQQATAGERSARARAPGGVAHQARTRGDGRRPVVIQRA